jgi:hypothetical protein
MCIETFLFVCQSCRRHRNGWSCPKEICVEILLVCD